MFKRIIFHFLAENFSEFSDCYENEFACFDENFKCVDRSALCDGSEDCPNGADEEPSKCNCAADQVSLKLLTTGKRRGKKEEIRMTEDEQSFFYEID